MKSSMSSIVDRRRLVAGLLLAPILTTFTTGCVTGRSRTETGPLYSALLVNVEPVRAKGIDGYADKIALYQKRGLAAAYQGAVAANKALPTLTAEIHSISFGSETESFSFTMGTNQPVFPQRVSITDWLEGFAVIRQGGKEIKRVKVLAAHRTEGHRQWSMADDEQRLIELTRFFADRVREELGD
ncbi:MAG: hypothetical protein RLZZ496_541 [Pseudomonadota bacterium]